MGHPNEIPEVYEASSMFPYAKNLKAEMLVYHGMADDKVLSAYSTKLFKHLP
jgi:dipeptidyl-peptidase-4